MALIQSVKDNPEDKQRFFDIFDRIVGRLLPQEAADVTISQLKRAEALAKEMAGEPK